MATAPGAPYVRIIAGEFKGRRLEAPEGLDTRPILDRLKVTLFDVLQGSFPCGRCIDVFAGSGSLGFEALSRGAERVRFVERDRRAVAVLERNAATLRVGPRVEIRRENAEDFLLEGEGPLGVVFFDPPFPRVVAEPAWVVGLLARVARHPDFLAASRIFLRVPRRDAVPPSVPGLENDDDRPLGESRLLLYRRSPTSSDVPAPLSVKDRGESNRSTE